MPLLLDPAPLLVLDEHPGLSAETAARLADWLPDRLHSRQGALLLATQKLDLVQALCDRLFVLFRGSLVADELVERSIGQLRRSAYTIRVHGRVGTAGLPGLETFSTRHEGGDTVISGIFEDQSALFGVLARLRDLGLVLLSVDLLQES